MVRLSVASLSQRLGCKVEVPSLSEILLPDSQIDEIVGGSWARFVSLRRCDFSGNRFQHRRNVEALREIPGLRELSIRGCPLEKREGKESLRAFLIALLPTLQRLDDEDVRVDERNEAFEKYPDYRPTESEERVASYVDHLLSLPGVDTSAKSLLPVENPGDVFQQRMDSLFISSPSQSTSTVPSGAQQDRIEDEEVNHLPETSIPLSETDDDHKRDTREYDILEDHVDTHSRRAASHVIQDEIFSAPKIRSNLASMASSKNTESLKSSSSKNSAKSRDTSVANLNVFEEALSDSSRSLTLRHVQSEIVARKDLNLGTVYSRVREEDRRTTREREISEGEVDLFAETKRSQFTLMPTTGVHADTIIDANVEEPTEGLFHRSHKSAPATASSKAASKQSSSTGGELLREKTYLAAIDEEIVSAKSIKQSSSASQNLLRRNEVTSSTGGKKLLFTSEKKSVSGGTQMIDDDDPFA